MRRILFLFIFVVAASGFKYAYCQDNLLAVDALAGKQKALTQENKTPAKDENSGEVEAPIEQVKPLDDSDRDLKEIKAYREVLENKKK